MAGFKGKYEHAVDDKGRVSLPSKIRKYLAPEANDSFVITLGYENCLDLYPLDVWNAFEAQMLTRLNRHDAPDRDYIRRLMMSAHEVTLDKQARIMIPQEHMELAGISAQVIILGALDHIELWGPEHFRTYTNHLEQQPIETVAARVMGGR